MSMTMTIARPHETTCDEIACRLLSYDNIVEAKHARKYITEISAYYYEGPFEDGANLIVGPDYSILYADCCLDQESHIDAYTIGLRSKESCISRFID